MVNNWNNHISGWCWLEPWNFMTFHILGIINNPNWPIPSFFRGVGWNHQPAMMIAWCFLLGLDNLSFGYTEAQKISMVGPSHCFICIRPLECSANISEDRPCFSMWMFPTPPLSWVFTLPVMPTPDSQTLVDYCFGVTVTYCGWKKFCTS